MNPPEVTPIGNLLDNLERCLPIASDRHPVTHRVKSWPESFRAVLTGRKRFEVRRDDRDYQTGDAIELAEWDEARASLAHHGKYNHPGSYGFTGRSTLMLIGYVQRGAPMPPGWCAFDIISAEEINRIKLALRVRS